MHGHYGVGWGSLPDPSTTPTTIFTGRAPSLTTDNAHSQVGWVAQHALVGGPLQRTMSSIHGRRVAFIRCWVMAGDLLLMLQTLGWTLALFHKVQEPPGTLAIPMRFSHLCFHVHVPIGKSR